MRVDKGILSMVAIIVAITLYQSWVIASWWNKPSVNPYIAVYVNIPAGVTLTRIAQELNAQGLITHPRYFIWLARLHPKVHLKVGEYFIPSKASPAQIFMQLSQGRVVQYSITFVDGWNFSQLKKTLDTQPGLKHLLRNTPPAEILAQLGYPPAWPEGLMYPDTYFYTRDTTDKALLQRAYQAMQQRLQLAWQNRAPDLPYTSAYQALIAASLIEKETAVTSELPLVASVIVNRLRLDMPLQIDPTVIYGLAADYTGHITTQDLQRNTVYNTYLHRGLPPTPIAMPSADAINAALHPAATNYIFFVAKGNGEHQFSATLSEHNQAVKRYLQMLQTR